MLETGNATSYQLTVINKSEVSYSCITYFYYPQDSLQSLQIECNTGDCTIIQETTQPLSIDSLSITTQRATVPINLINFVGDAVDIDIKDGTISLHHMEVASSASLSTKNGDIIYQSIYSFAPEWTNQNQFYCLAYPDTPGAMAGNFSDSCKTSADVLTS